MPNFPATPTCMCSATSAAFVLGADGVFSLFGSDWTWSGYFEHGQNDTAIRVREISLNPRYIQAADAVRDPRGAIVCRSAAAQASGCAALNIIGNVAPDPLAIAYVIPANGPYQLSHERQEAFSASANGFALCRTGPAASPLPAAWNIGKKSLSGVQRQIRYGNGVTADDPNTAAYPADPVLNAAGNNWYAGNFHNAGGNYHVTEAFSWRLRHSPAGRQPSLGHSGRPQPGSPDHGLQHLRPGHDLESGCGVGCPARGFGMRLRVLQSRDVRLRHQSSANCSRHAQYQHQRHCDQRLHRQQRHGAQCRDRQYPATAGKIPDHLMYGSLTCCSRSWLACFNPARSTITASP